MEKPILVSVAIPTYNQEKYIEQTVLSVMNQTTDFDYEVVNGDDNSTDSTRTVLLDLEKISR